MNERIYTINYRKLVVWLVPQLLRKARMVAWLMALVSPMVWIYNQLLGLRKIILYKLTITPQVVYLEKMLNDRYDTSDRRIYINDGQEYTSLPVFQREEAKPVFMFRKTEEGVLQTLLYTKSETAQFTYDFIIHIPVFVSFDVNELTALVNSYKLAGKSYKIQIH